jgi:tetratricopeptide (TPR) repeat protein
MLHAQYCFITGDYAGTIEVSEQVVAISQKVGKTDMALDVYPVWSHALFRSGKPDHGLRIGMHGLQLARQAGKLVELGRALSSIGLMALEYNEPGFAQGYLEEALVIARETKERMLESRVLQNLANSAAYVQRDYLRARTYYEQVSALVVENGDRYGQALSLGNLGWVCGMLGDFVAARRYHEQALIVAREVGNAYQESYTLMNLSGVAEVQGVVDEAIQYAIQADELCRKNGDKPGEAWSSLYVGYAYLLTNELGKARAAFEQALAIRRDLGQSALASEPLAGLIQVALKRDDIPFASRLMEELMQYLSNGGTLDGTEEPLRVYLACYAVLERTGDSRAADILQTAMQLLEAQVAKINIEASRRMYIENVPWRREIERLWLTGKERI